MSKDRRGMSLKIAASMLRRMNSNESIPTPEMIVRYAKTLDEYMYNGEVPEGNTEYTLGYTLAPVGD